MVPKTFCSAQLFTTSMFVPPGARRHLILGHFFKQIWAPGAAPGAPSAKFFVLFLGNIFIWKLLNAQRPGPAISVFFRYFGKNLWGQNPIHYTNNEWKYWYATYNSNLLYWEDSCWRHRTAFANQHRSNSRGQVYMHNLIPMCMIFVTNIVMFHHQRPYPLLNRSSYHDRI